MIITMRVLSTKRYQNAKGSKATILTLVDDSKGPRCSTTIEYYASDDRHADKGDLSSWQDKQVNVLIEDIEAKNGKISVRGDINLSKPNHGKAAA